MKKASGRPRDKEARANILAATMRLLETSSVQAVTIEAIAKAAGVSKATIYRWWRSKASVVIDAVIEHHVVVTPMPRDLPPRQALEQHIRSLITVYTGLPGRLVAQIIAEGQHDPTVLREFRERFYYGRRAVVREVLEDWRRSGDLDLDIELELLADILYAPIYLRLMIGHAPLDAGFGDVYPGRIFDALGLDDQPAEEEWEGAATSDDPPPPSAAKARRRDDAG